MTDEIDDEAFESRLRLEHCLVLSLVVSCFFGCLFDLDKEDDMDSDEDDESEIEDEDDEFDETEQIDARFLLSYTRERLLDRCPFPIAEFKMVFLLTCRSNLSDESIGLESSVRLLTFWSV
jgi:hypothetical protein